MSDLDPVARYALSIGYRIAPRTIIVEGRTDYELFTLAVQEEHRHSNGWLLGGDLAVIAAGDGDEGGTAGVIRQLITLRNIARTDLSPKGLPRYRFLALFDDDRAGRQAVRAARELDRSMTEFKDVFRLRPIMPLTRHAEPALLQKHFNECNASYKNIEWEVEDLLGSDLMCAFCNEHPTAVSSEVSAGDVVHRHFTRDGKARLHRFVRENAMRRDLSRVIDVVKAFRLYLGLNEGGAS